ncbi:hypothetical protein PS874_06341 [Pseudomonas fluorescens]|nr:hypothetical protein PS874_06341 [Pseudomonas fluorescens]
MGIKFALLSSGESPLKQLGLCRSEASDFKNVEAQSQVTLRFQPKHNSS